MRKILFIIIPLVMLASCFEEQPDYTEKPGVSFDKETFYREWELWNKNGYTNYSVVQKLKDGGTGPEGLEAKIVVKEGRIVDIIPSRYRDDYGDEFDILIKSYRLKTIPEAFAYLEDRYNEYQQDISNGSINERIVISVTYNSRFHYPECISFSSVHGYDSTTTRTCFILNPQ